MELLNTEYIKLSNNELEKIIIKIIYDFENLEINNIIRDINEDRIVSGFPEVNDFELVENYLKEKKRNCVKLILNSLNSLDTKQLIDIMTRIVDEETANGEIQASSMIEDLVDDYKLHTQNFLEQEFEKIKKLIDVIRDRADEGEDCISALIDKLLQITKNWDNVAQPIQLSMKSRGLDEPLSQKVANTIRSLSINLTNDYGYLK
jgi:histone acetyltransferase (RNA polymerase elongator complex component)